eukprot:TRINITY_DN909_c0_g1_i2.p1 TRINITY_DN909_c0_g1~~TRINITY_DN909_c0_g1_i2.p1  ORF type:complete len:601 (+),score=87.24 TRINITY_DN909_c0_g1_i2:167-1969(+)
MATNIPKLPVGPRGRAGSDPLSGSRSPSPRELDKENMDSIPPLSPFQRSSEKLRSPRSRRHPDASFADEDEVDKIGIWINGISKSPRVKTDTSYVERPVGEGMSLLQETSYKTFDDSLNDRSFLDSSIDSSVADVAQAYERLAVEIEGVRAEKHVVSEIKTRLEHKVVDLQEETSRLRDENTALRSRVQQLELGLPDDGLDASNQRRSSLSLREQRIHSELQNSTEIIHGLQKRIEEIGKQLSEAQDTIAHQEGLLRLADADVFVAKIKEQEIIILELRGQVRNLESHIEQSRLDKSKWDLEFATLLHEKEGVDMMLKQLQSELYSVEQFRDDIGSAESRDQDLSMYTADEDSLPSTPIGHAERDGNSFNTPYKTPRKRHNPTNTSVQQLASSPLAGSDSPIRFQTTMSPFATQSAVLHAPSVIHTPFKSFDEFGTLSPIFSSASPSHLSLRERISETSTSAARTLVLPPSVEDASSSSEEECVTVDNHELRDLEDRSHTASDGLDDGDKMTAEETSATTPLSYADPTIKACRPGMRPGAGLVPRLKDASSWVHLTVTVILFFLLLATLRCSGRLSDSGEALTVWDVLRDTLGMTFVGGV